MWLQKLLKDCTTGIDGVTFDPWRIAAAVSLATLAANATYATVISHTFNALDFGGGCAAILAGAGWGIRQKKETEPTQ